MADAGFECGGRLDDALLRNRKAQGLFLRVEKNVTPNVRPVQDKYLSFTHIMMKSLTNGVPDKEPPASSLVRVPDIFKGTVPETLVEALNETADAALVYRHEFFGMAGDAGRLQDTLGAYVSQGVLWGQDKAFLFPKMPPHQKGKPTVHAFADLPGK